MIIYDMIRMDGRKQKVFTNENGRSRWDRSWAIGNLRNRFTTPFPTSVDLSSLSTFVSVGKIFINSNIKNKNDFRTENMEEDNQTLSDSDSNSDSDDNYDDYDDQQRIALENNDFTKRSIYNIEKKYLRLLTRLGELKTLADGAWTSSSNRLSSVVWTQQEDNQHKSLPDLGQGLRIESEQTKDGEKDRKELHLAQARHDLVLLRHHHERLYQKYQSAKCQLEEITDHHRLAIHEVINLKARNQQLQQNIRSQERKWLSIECQFMAFEDHHSRLSSCLVDYQRQAKLDRADKIRLKQEIESMRMLAEDTKSRNVERFLLQKKITNRNEYLEKEFMRLSQYIHHKKASNQMEYDLISLRGQKNAWEKKAISLSQELKKRLRLQGPTNRELKLLKQKLEQAEQERDAFKQAMVDIIQSNNQRYSLDNKSSSKCSNHITPWLCTSGDNVYR